MNSMRQHNTKRYLVSIIFMKVLFYRYGVGFAQALRSLKNTTQKMGFKLFTTSFVVVRLIALMALAVHLDNAHAKMFSLSLIPTWSWILFAFDALAFIGAIGAYFYNCATQKQLICPLEDPESLFLDTWWHDLIIAGGILGFVFALLSFIPLFGLYGIYLGIRLGARLVLTACQKIKSLPQALVDKNTKFLETNPEHAAKLLKHALPKASHIKSKTRL